LTIPVTAVGHGPVSHAATCVDTFVAAISHAACKLSSTTRSPTLGVFDVGGVVVVFFIHAVMIEEMARTKTRNIEIVSFFRFTFFNLSIVEVCVFRGKVFGSTFPPSAVSLPFPCE